MEVESYLTSIVDWINKYLPEGSPNYIAEAIVSIAVFISFLLIGYLIYHIFEHYFTQWARKTKTKLDDEILKNIKKPIYVFVIIYGLYYAIKILSYTQNYSDIVRILFVFIEIFLIAFIITRVVNVLIAWYAEKRAKEKMSEHILFVLRNIINGIIVVIAFLFVLNTLEVDLSGVVVGFGVTGIVLGFALQNVLADFFSAFSIYFDRPFEIGDFVVIGEYSGTVKKIKMQSTRIKLLQGEELVLSNKVLTSSSVRNFKKMRKRRISFSFGVTYDTPYDKLEKIPDIIRRIINSENLEYVDRLDRVHFSKFGDFSLNFDVVYYIKNQDYMKYMDTQQAINYEMKKVFEKEGIEFAFPTQTIYLNKENS